MWAGTAEPHHPFGTWTGLASSAMCSDPQSKSAITIHRQLGEHGEWGKHTNFELSLQVPLIIRAPWLPQSAGKHTSSFVELVDLYRTLASLAGLPADAIAADVDGGDNADLLSSPQKVLKQEAYSQYSRCPGDRFWPKRMPGQPADIFNNCEAVPAHNITAMGYSIRTVQWRFTEWYAWDGASCVAKFEKALGTELYDHRIAASGSALDFDATENENVASAQPDVVAALRKKLQLRFATGASLGCPPDPTAEQSYAALEDGAGLLDA
jgi:iduronate 2-sulfatase|mmetsp:Transcript_19691/g.43958  ORF Transcript_19691/g.43958 Transcript_19691/m.43958 type:complete len:267 (-) Transcript_19691:397-1197(-)